MTVGTWFGTDYDAAPTVQRPPVDVVGGNDPALAITDQLARGTGIVGRVTGEYAAAAVRIRTDGMPAHVRVDLGLDEAATRRWADRVDPVRGQPERPRLVLVRSQGRLRGAVLLARRQGWFGATAAHQRLEFEVPAAELADGLLVVELADGTPGLPSWASSRLSTGGPIGVRVERISVRLADGAPLRPPVADSGTAFVVLPAGGPQRRSVDLAVHLVPPAPSAPRTPQRPWAQRRPARAVTKVMRLTARVAGRALAGLGGRRGSWVGRRWVGRRQGRFAVRAVDLATGLDCPLDAGERGRDRVRATLTAPAGGPILVGLVDARRPRRERTAWQLACRPSTTTPAGATGCPPTGSAPA